jgi:hypothetical protein
MKTLKNKFNTLFFLIIIGISLVSCSKDDDNDPSGDSKGGQATALIEIDNQTIQFSAKTGNSFAAITKTQFGENEFNQLTVVMMDDNSDVTIATQVVPAPDNPIDYDLSNVGLGTDDFFTTSVAVEGENSSDNNIYGVGFYQQGEEVVIKSKGSFKITSLTKTNIRGTFEMTLYNSYDPNNAQDAKKLTVTEGEFDLPMLSQAEIEDLGLN